MHTYLEDGIHWFWILVENTSTLKLILRLSTPPLSQMFSGSSPGPFPAFQCFKLKSYSNIENVKHWNAGNGPGDEGNAGNGSGDEASSQTFISTWLTAVQLGDPRWMLVATTSSQLFLHPVHDRAFVNNNTMATNKVYVEALNVILSEVQHNNYCHLEGGCHRCVAKLAGVY